jgi:hypothetical protein
VLDVMSKVNGGVGQPANVSIGRAGERISYVPTNSLLRLVERRHGLAWSPTNLGVRRDRIGECIKRLLLESNQLEMQRLKPTLQKVSPRLPRSRGIVSKRVPLDYQ